VGSQFGRLYSSVMDFLPIWFVRTKEARCHFLGCENSASMGWQ
jgi:hypothetical protein